MKRAIAEIDTGVDEVTRRALTGHITKEMTEHYSTVRLDETRAAMQAAANRLGAASGDRGGDRGEKERPREGCHLRTARLTAT